MRETLEAGEWETPKMSNYMLECCDCGLVHTLDFKIEDGVLSFRAFRNNRATGQTRRRKKEQAFLDTRA